jgi:hypothetical protein
MNDDGQFTLRSPLGEIIATGPLSMLMERIPQSVPRMRAEEAIAAAAKAVAREQRLEARADSLDQREAEVKAREDAILADGIKRFVDGVSALAARMDAYEQKAHQRALDRLPDPDNPQDDLEAVLEAPGPKQREQERELAEAEEAIEKGDALELRHAESGGAPGQVLPSSPLATEPYEGNELPENTMFPIRHDSLGLLGQRGRKVARKRMLANRGV